MSDEDAKQVLTARRMELIQEVNTTTNMAQKMALQSELSAVNAQIKHINTLTAIEAKRVADLKRMAGQAEHQANTHDRPCAFLCCHLS